MTHATMALEGHTITITGPDAEAIAKRLQLSDLPQEWRTGPPPKLGVYKVRRVGKASTQRGYARWDGEHWGMIYSQYKYARKPHLGPKRPSKYPMEWLVDGRAREAA